MRCKDGKYEWKMALPDLSVCVPWAWVCGMRPGCVSASASSASSWPESGDGICQNRRQRHARGGQKRATAAAAAAASGPRADRQAAKPSQAQPAPLPRLVFWILTKSSHPHTISSSSSSSHPTYSKVSIDIGTITSHTTYIHTGHRCSNEHSLGLHR